MKRTAPQKLPSPLSEHRRQHSPIPRNVLTPLGAPTARAALQELPSPLSEHRRQHNPIPRNVLTPLGAFAEARNQAWAILAPLGRQEGAV
ncbi:MAG: hypothetical protein WAN43_04775 [Rhodomicrobium sp.]